MGIFRKAAVKKSNSGDSSKSGKSNNNNNNVDAEMSQLEPPVPQSPPPNITTTSPTPTSPESGRSRAFRRGDTFPMASFSPSDSKLDVVPKLVEDLRNAKDTSSEKTAKALRSLFALTEHHSENHHHDLVHAGDQSLVPAVLEFLQRCEIGTSEQYLTLLVLNNLSIPRENKRFIALDCRGVHVLSQLLCSNPSCHLIAIILVNLTHADAELRKELASLDLELIQSLAYALMFASLTPEEYAARQHILESGDTNDIRPGLLLAALLDFEKYDDNKSSVDSLLFPFRQQFPITARWCLSALKNLTKPSDDGSLCKILIDTGVVPLILRYITVGVSPLHVLHEDNHEGSESSSNDTPSPADPIQSEEINNDPSNWDSHSMQDAALFIIMNLAATAESRCYVRDAHAIPILTHIAETRDRASTATRDYTIEEIKQLEFQCMKAKMSLAYLIGSEGHFGQPKMKYSTIYPNPDESVLLLTETEVALLMELLANVLHNRGKEGPGGYSAATFGIQYVLLAIRCLLTNLLNQLRFMNTVDMRLNALLMKALALHSITRTPNVDPVAAEYAAFSLYLLSNHGFQMRFLPSFFGGEAKSGNLASKVLTSYVHRDDITPAGRHAADQLLLRLKYLNFRGTITELACPNGDVPTADDFKFDAEILTKAECIIVEKRIHGTKPQNDIFSRPILRGRAPRKGSRRCAPWDRSTVSVFSSALQAVQELSYGSTKVRHADAIDDILIANNIANSANGEKTESYHYWWSWQDKAGEIQKNLVRQRSGDSTTIFSGVSTKGFVPSVTSRDEPMSFFGLRCAGLCATDTTESK